MITIFGKDDCVWCDRAQEVCRQYNLDFTYKSLDDRFDGQTHTDELKAVYPEAKTVPVIFWANNYIGGYNELVTEIENTRSFGDGAL